MKQRISPSISDAKELTLPALVAVSVDGTVIGEREVCGWLPESDRARIRALKRRSDRRRATVAVLLFRWSLAEHAGLDATSMVVARDDLGRPQVDAEADANISHSGEWVVVGVAARARVGVDIEWIGARALSTRGGWLAEEERRFVESLPPNQHQQVLYALWTAKEAYVKAIGSGLRHPLAGVAFDVAALAEGRLRPGRGSQIDPRWRFHAYQLDLAYRLTWCSQTPLIPGGVEVLRWSDLQCWAEGRRSASESVTRGPTWPIRSGAKQRDSRV